MPPWSFAQRSGSSDLASLTLAEASELVRTKKVSPVELTEACLRRIEQRNPELNAFITVPRTSLWMKPKRGGRIFNAACGWGPCTVSPSRSKIW